MTPDALAAQQLWAAWVAAGAACVQAIGAVGAIAISVKLARDSARREVEAQSRSEEREAAAEAASIARERAADEAATNRLREQSTDERRAFIIPILGAAEKARLALLKEAEKYRAADQPPHRMHGPLGNTETHLLYTLIKEVKFGAKAAFIAIELRNLESLLDPANDQHVVRSWGDLISGKDELAGKIQRFIAHLDFY